MYYNNKEKFIDMPEFDIMAIVQRAIKYLIEGLAVAVAAYYIPKKKMQLEEIAMIAVSGALTFALLDMYSPVTSQWARHGAGFGIGAMQVGYGK